MKSVCLISILLLFSNLALSQIINLDSIESIQKFDDWSFIGTNYKHLQIVKTKNGKSHIYNENTKEIIGSFDFVHETLWGDDLVKIRVNGKNGFFSLKSLSIVIPPIYYELDRCRNWDGMVDNCLRAQDSMYNSGLLNYKGDTIFDFGNHFIRTDGIHLDKELIILYDAEENKTKLVNLEGKPLCEKSYSGFGHIIGKYCFVRKDSKQGLIDLQCNEIVEPIYDDVSFLIDGHRKVKLNDKFGLVDEFGKVKLKPVFTSIISEYDNARPRKLTGYRLTYEDYTFYTDVNFNCVLNCNEEILSEILLD